MDIIRDLILTILAALIIVSVVYFLVSMFILLLKKISDKTPEKDAKKILWLSKESEKWISSGILTQNQKDLILNQYQIIEKRPIKRVHLIKVLSIIGSSLLGVGLILFVAANWREISTQVKTILLLSVTLGTLLFGYLLTCEYKGFRLLGKSLLFLSCIFWGATLALIGQMYHLPTTGNWLIFLLWAFPILPVAHFFNSSPVYLLSSGLFFAWNLLFITSQNTPNYYYPLIVFLILLPLARNLPYQSLTNVGLLLLTAFVSLLNGHSWVLLLIAAGFLFYYFWKRNQSIYLTSCSLAMALWIISIFLTNKPYALYYFMIPLILLFYLTYKEKTQLNLFINLLALIIGFNLGIFKLTEVYFNRILMPFLILQATIGIIVYLAGIWHYREENKSFKQIYKVVGFCQCLLAIYLLSFKDLLKIIPGVEYHPYQITSIFIGTFSILMLIYSYLLNRFNTKVSIYEYILSIMIISGTIYALLHPASMAINTVIMNILLLLLAIITILYGFENHSLKIFNAGIFIFITFLITRYFDLLWGLLDRSIFFMAGGLILIITAIILERKRKVLLKVMKN